MGAIDILNTNSYSKTIEETDSEEKGSLSKKWYSIDKTEILAKSNSIDCYEPISEVLASNMASVLDVDHVSYKIGRLADFSKYIKSPDDYQFVSLCQKYYPPNGYSICSMYDYIMEYIKYNMLDDRHISDTDILAFMNRLGNTERDKFFSIIQFDAIICNIDGHKNNIELFISSNGKEIKLAPVFDRGQSILHDLDSKGKYMLDTARTLRATHRSQIEFVKSLGYTNTFGNPERIYNEWVELSSDVFSIMSKTNGTIIKDFIKRRLDLYAQI